MLMLLRHASFALIVPVVAGLTTVLLFLLFRWFHLRTMRSLHEAALLRYSNLHLLATTLSQSDSPKQMTEQTPLPEQEQPATAATTARQPWQGSMTPMA